ncbi:MAG: c-type cytochrome domain-containing protein [Pirellula sp.]
MARALRDSTVCLVLLGVALSLGLPHALATDWNQRNEQYSSKIQPILTKYCLGCHSGAQAESGLALNNFADAKSVFRERRIWEKVAQRLDIADMPPADSPQPAEAVRKRGSEWINCTLNDI